METILAAATDLLASDGHAALTTRRVAARAGVRPGHLQYYYPAKRDLVRGILERHLARAIDTVESRVAARAAGGATRLDVLLDGLLAAQDAASCRIFWELWALAARDPAVGEAMHAFYRRYWQALVVVLLDVAPGLGRPRAERRAALVIAMLEGLTLFRSPPPARAFPLPHLERELRAAIHRLATDPA